MTSSSVKTILYRTANPTFYTRAQNVTPFARAQPWLWDFFSMVQNLHVSHQTQRKSCPFYILAPSKPPQCHRIKFSPVLIKDHDSGRGFEIGLTGSESKAYSGPLTRG